MSTTDDRIAQLILHAPPAPADYEYHFVERVIQLGSGMVSRPKVKESPAAHAARWAVDYAMAVMEEEVRRGMLLGVNLYGFQPDGAPGPKSFYVCAATEAEARAAVGAHVAAAEKRDPRGIWNGTWPGEYSLTVARPGAVLENTNE